MAVVNQNVLLYLNTITRTITYQNSTKHIDDKYWDTSIIPLLYPLWHSDRDKLEVFSAFKDGGYHITRNKYVRNHKESTGKWVSYEFELADLDPDAAEALTNSLVQAYLDYKDSLNVSIETAMEREFVQKVELSWIKIRLIRNFLLSDCDYIMMPDYECDPAEMILWKRYRQYLRDITEKGFPTPSDVQFPITPIEYLARIEEQYPAEYGDMGRSDEYLTNTEYHFWSPTVNTLENWNQRMAIYMALKIRTVPAHTLSEVYTRKVRRRFGENPFDMESTEGYVNSLLEAIEDGRL